MRGIRFSTSLALVALAIGLMLPAGASAEVAGDDICPDFVEPALMGDSIAEAVQFPYVPAANPQRYYDGAILRPSDTSSFPGKRPSVILQPGLGQDKCTLWWAAQYLAGHGFVVTVHDTPDPGLEEDPDFPYVVDWIRVAIAGDVSVVDYLENDVTASTYADVDHLGFAGYDEGALVASVIDTSLLAPGEETSLGIDAIISFNNLRSRLTGDVSGNGLQCYGEPQGSFVPASPALGFAEDEPCDGLPTVFDPSIKLGGWKTWRSYGFPTMEIVPRGAKHEDFADENGTQQFWGDVGHYSAAWFRRWLELDPSQDEELLTATLNGRPTIDALSRTFQSAAFLPPATDTDDLTCALDGPCLAVVPDPPDPPGPPDLPGRPGVADIKSKMKLSSRKVRPGGTIKVTVTVRNAGTASGDARLCGRTGKLVASGKRCRKLKVIAPGEVRKVPFRMRAKRSARPRGRTSIGYSLGANGSIETSGASVRITGRPKPGRS